MVMLVALEDVVTPEEAAIVAVVDMETKNITNDQNQGDPLIPTCT